MNSGQTGVSALQTGHTQPVGMAQSSDTSQAGVNNSLQGTGSGSLVSTNTTNLLNQTEVFASSSAIPSTSANTDMVKAENSPNYLVPLLVVVFVVLAVSMWAIRLRVKED